MTTLENEILILKEDIERQRYMIETLREENWNLKDELKMTRSDSMEFKTFSIESSKAIEELLSLLSNDNNYSYIRDQDLDIFNESYNIYSKLGNLIFIIETNKDNQTLLITPPISNVSKNNRILYEEYTFNWENYSISIDRRKLIINGQTYSTILNLLKKFN